MSVYEMFFYEKSRRLIFLLVKFRYFSGVFVYVTFKKNQLYLINIFFQKSQKIFRMEKGSNDAQKGSQGSLAGNHSEGRRATIDSTEVSYIQSDIYVNTSYEIYIGYIRQSNMHQCQILKNSLIRITESHTTLTQHTQHTHNTILTLKLF